MIVSRAPFRISLFGGGTDYPVWYREEGGCVISTSINKYCFVTLRSLPPFFDYKYRIRYFEREETSSLDEVKHPSVRECLRYTGIQHGVEMVHHADLPARSGLGSSSTFTVCMLHACYALKSVMVTKLQLALDAIRVEQDVHAEAVGSQDQTAAAFGGLNRIDFGGAREVMVTPLIVPKDRLAEFEKHLLLVFTGLQRTAGTIAAEQIRLTHERTSELREMMALANTAQDALVNVGPLAEVGRLLHHQWTLKRGLTDAISTAAIDDIYSRGLKAGAIGGKLLGAGGGGFMLFFAEPESHERIRASLPGLLHVPVNLDFAGSQIVYFGHHA